MKVKRTIASIPKRSAAETWRTIRELITSTGSVDVDKLVAAASVMESLIADEHPGAVPIVVKGVGSRLVIYCLYGEDAMEADLEVEKLTWNPTAGNWAMTAPTDADDVKWMNDTLAKRCSRITVHDVNAAPQEEEEDSAATAKSLTVNWGAIE
ncbi:MULTISPECIES: hypothetical protein [Rhizobium]|uniref:Uncharacterized protein n=1 Tax=Rhizobium johnstonii (strain DSM 114642 / LMG 32736 / 3841) TaxID=216596 RepID=Q1MH89_RHIJ3|nr:MULTISPECIES: hypothetical protein [Rhizobium]NEI92384.1 hypothetical protein [Rhizobium leguminosarum]CAK07677.1 conserved hypothetical protein [Rhizobium johnstonii 3841]